MKPLRTTEPQEARWDYGVGVGGGDDEPVYWLEAHPANAVHVSDVLEKKRWFASWLRQNAPELAELRARWVWLATGRVAITPNSPQARRLAQAGVVVRSSGFALERF